MSKKYSVTGRLLAIADIDASVIQIIDLARVERIDAYTVRKEIYIHCNGVEIDVTGINYAKLVTAWAEAVDVNDEAETIDITKVDA